MKNVYSVFDYDQNRIGFAARNGTTAVASTPTTVAASLAQEQAAQQPQPALRNPLVQTTPAHILAVPPHYQSSP